MPPDPPTEAAMRLLPPSAAWLLEPPPIQNPGYATERHHYNDQCELARLSLERVNDSSTVTPEYMHYSFDFAYITSTFSLFSSATWTAFFFRTPRKCGLFGVCCEATSSQVNYLIDESDMHGW